MLQVKVKDWFGDVFTIAGDEASPRAVAEAWSERNGLPRDALSVVSWEALEPGDGLQVDSRSAPVILPVPEPAERDIRIANDGWNRIDRIESPHDTRTLCGLRLIADGNRGIVWSETLTPAIFPRPGA